MKPVKYYRAKSLFSGSVIGQEKDNQYIAIPEKGFKGYTIIVEYKGVKMTVPDWLKAESFRRFPDKWGRGTYTLGYFKFMPDEINDK